MDAISASHSYQDIELRHEWVQGDEYDVLLVDVSGFKKDQLKVQVDEKKNLEVLGDCYKQGNQRHFLRSFLIPKNCDAKKIQANLDEGILYVILPKAATNVHSLDKDLVPSKNKTLEHKMREDSPNGSETSSGQHPLEKLKQNMGAIVKGFGPKRQLIVNIVVAIAVVGLGTYARYKLKVNEETYRG